MTEEKPRRARANGLPPVPVETMPGTSTTIVCLDRAARRYAAIVTFVDSGLAVGAYSLTTRAGRDHWLKIDINGIAATKALRKAGIKRSRYAATMTP